MLTTQTAVGCTRGSATSKVQGGAGEAKLANADTSGPGGGLRIHNFAHFPDGVVSAGFDKHAALTPRQPPATAARTHTLVENCSTHSSKSYVSAIADTVSNGQFPQCGTISCQLTHSGVAHNPQADSHWANCSNKNWPGPCLCRVGRPGTEPHATHDKPHEQIAAMGLSSLAVESGNDARNRGSEITPSRSLACAATSMVNKSPKLCTTTAHIRNHVLEKCCHAKRIRNLTDWAYRYPLFTDTALLAMWSSATMDTCCSASCQDCSVDQFARAYLLCRKTADHQKHRSRAPSAQCNPRTHSPTPRCDARGDGEPYQATGRSH